VAARPFGPVPIGAVLVLSRPSTHVASDTPHCRYGRRPAACQNPRLAPARTGAGASDQGFARRCQVLRGRYWHKADALISASRDVICTEQARRPGRRGTRARDVRWRSRRAQTSDRSSAASANVLQMCWAVTANVQQTSDRRNPAKPSETTHANPANLRRLSPAFADIRDSVWKSGRTVRVGFSERFSALLRSICGPPYHPHTGVTRRASPGVCHIEQACSQSPFRCRLRTHPGRWRGRIAVDYWRPHWIGTRD
jgi:hypothetical protein